MKMIHPLKKYKMKLKKEKSNSPQTGLMFQD
jgi:hypothetical protein